MAQIFNRSGVVEKLELANNRLSNLPSWVALISRITSINLENNLLTEIPSPLPPHLTTLRLAGNPIVDTDDALSPAVTLLETITQQTALTTFSVGFSAAVIKDEAYLLTNMPGMSDGMARCPSRVLGAAFNAVDPTGSKRRAVGCPFVINTAGFDQFDYRATGGLGLHYCLNTTAGCDCENWAPPYPATCLPLLDHHDGTYSGVLILQSNADFSRFLILNCRKNGEFPLENDGFVLKMAINFAIRGNRWCLCRQRQARILQILPAAAGR